MSNPIIPFLRKIGLLPPVSAVQRRKPDMDALFNLYNVAIFKDAFENGMELTKLKSEIAHVFLRAERLEGLSTGPAGPRFSALQQYLRAISHLSFPSHYDVQDWRCLAIDVLRYHCSELVNDLLYEFDYDDHICNHQVIMRSALRPILNEQTEYSDLLVRTQVNHVNMFLIAQSIDPVIANDYLVVLRHTLRSRHSR